MADPFGFGAEYGDAEYGDAEYGALGIVIPPAPAFTRDVNTPIAADEAVITTRIVYTPVAAEDVFGALLITWNVFNTINQPLPITWNVINGGLNASLLVTWNVVNQPISLPIVWNIIPNLIPSFNADIQQPTADVQETP